MLRSGIFSAFRFWMKCLTMPNSESEKVRKTLIEYMTTRAEIESVRVNEQTRAAATPIITMPLRIVSRPEKSAKRRGIQESTAMLAMTRGASMKPACEATRRRAPSDRIVTRARTLPATPKPPYSASARVEFRVRPSFGDDPREEIADEEAGRGYRERDGEVRHGLLAVLDPGLAHDLHAVRYGFDSGISAAAERVGAEEDDRQPRKPMLLRSVRRPLPMFPRPRPRRPPCSRSRRRG